MFFLYFYLLIFCFAKKSLILLIAFHSKVGAKLTFQKKIQLSVQKNLKYSKMM